MTGTKTSELSLDDRQLATFQTDGVLVLRDVLPSDVVTGLRAAFEHALAVLADRWHDRGLVEDTFAGHPLEERYELLLRSAQDLPVHGAWRRILVGPALHGLWRRPELLTPVRQILGDEVWAHGAWNGRLRDPLGRTSAVSWHQDAFYYKGWSARDAPMLSVWIPLVRVTAETSCLQLVRGSHLLGRVPSELTADGEFRADVPEPSAADVLTAELEVGDVVMFTDTTLHRSTPNAGRATRSSVDIRFARPTPNVVENSPRGYLCASADRPAEDFATWAARYSYSTDELADEMVITEHLPVAFRSRLRTVPDVDVF